ncbi:dapper homolog 3-like [Pongo abelii]|uniref:dapper homolog 3-like n=1 Tax=Pongo abelii TaxID=9601 RepID=UPI0023E89CBA|nr:dapper homolog 3-like [Pongo abelii]
MDIRPKAAAAGRPPRPHVWGGGVKPRRARSPLAKGAREPEYRRLRTPLPWGRGGGVEARARQERREGGREAKASAPAKGGKRACARRSSAAWAVLRALWPRAGAATPPPPGSLAPSPSHPPPPPAASEGERSCRRRCSSSRVPRAWGRRLASQVRPPQPTPTPPRFLRGRSGLRLRHSHPAWAALHVSTTNCVRQHANGPRGAYRELECAPRPFAQAPKPHCEVPFFQAQERFHPVAKRLSVPLASATKNRGSDAVALCGPSASSSMAWWRTLWCKSSSRPAWPGAQDWEAFAMRKACPGASTLFLSLRTRSILTASMSQ